MQISLNTVLAVYLTKARNKCVSTSNKEIIQDKNGDLLETGYGYAVQSINLSVSGNEY